MGVELNWEIDAAEDQARQIDDRRRGGGRRRKRLRLTAFLLLLVALAAGALWLRLREVQRQQERMLRATVEAEVTALRIGDLQAWLGIQDGGDPTRQLEGSRDFDAWQQRKLVGGDPAGGEILALALQGDRAWAQVQEFIAGEARAHTWFYRLGADGWRHVSAEAGWRGNARSHRVDGLRIDYDDIDDSLVQELAPQLEAWLKQACSLLECVPRPVLNVQVQARPGEARWSTDSSWTLLLPSPAAGLAYAGEALQDGLRNSLAQLLASRMILDRAGQPGPGWTREAIWLHASGSRWLTGRLLQSENGQHLLESLATLYDDGTVSRLLDQLHPAATLQLIDDVAGAGALLQGSLDWRDLLAWQLGLEDRYRQQGDRSAFLSLYDLRDPALEVLALARLAVGEFAAPVTVASVTQVSATEATALLRATVVDAGGSVPVHFRLVEGRWLRTS